ncbi:penicillin-binding protein [Mesobacillus harenae]|uniref:penicillin-binding protein n=1 Tax=Mesobacillus harenae TaxID=2213203 RepID=UPI001580D3A8|nr:penicillin-binding protein [Mesobacillus harenae]
MGKKQPNMNFGAAILFVIFSLLFFVLIYRFISIQVTGEAAGQALAARAELKYEKNRIIDAARGTIFDQKGEIIAQDTAAYTLVAILDESVTVSKENPKHVAEPEKTAKMLAEHIDMAESEIYNRLTTEGRFQIEFGKAGRDISHQVKREIENLKLPGITFIKDTKRFYPNGVFSSHLVGFVEKSENSEGKENETGKLGLEKTLNNQLTGKDGSLTFDSDFWGFLLPSAEKDITPAQHGNDVYLTIDKKIQTFLEDAINKVDNEYKPKKIVAIVADPKTGDILGMGQRPTFHPKTKEGLDATWHNEAVENSFEPGSTMKIFTLAAAVEDKVFNPNELYKSGTYRVTEKSSSIGDHNSGRGWGPISYLEGIQRSSNVAVARLVSEKIGFESFREHLDAFGFGKQTGIELENEATGKILYDWPIEKITTSYGQGSTVTAMQLVQAATAVANDGKMMKPRIIDKIVNSNTGDIIEQKDPVVAGQPISAETAKEVREVLETVVTSPKGTGFERYNIEGYNVAGKTGTANITGGSKYLTGAQDYLFSFLGMAPTDDPELIVYVAVQQPQIDHYSEGSVPVSMIFNTVMKSSLQYLNIKPTQLEKADAGKVPDYRESTVDDAVKDIQSKGFTPIVLGNGSKVIKQLPAADSTVLEGEKILIMTEGKTIVPDLTGWSLRDVMKVAQIANLKLNKAGSGYVVKQNVQSGGVLKEGEYLIVQLETPLEQFEKSLEPEGELEEDEVVD